jgi:Pyruvate/2-oxoacid:ferredoxin oxidoreductase delta subunit
VPDPEQLALMPEVSGNAVNGVGETDRRRPTPIYHHDPERTPFAALQTWFRARPSHASIDAARRKRIPIMEEPIAPLADSRREATPEVWSADVKAKGRELGAQLMGITGVKPEWVFEGFDVPHTWMIVIGVAMDYKNLATAPDAQSVVEVVTQYGRGTQVAKRLAGWVRSQGWDAFPHCGPDAGPILLIPAALACGFGELGKHGSIINRELGSSFRLACVLTDLPLIADDADSFGADEFCVNCRVCSQACPPDAISAEKQMVRGDTKWSVDFDKCVPYFNETTGCGICIAVCPWSRPGVAANLVSKLARRRKA